MCARSIVNREQLGWLQDVFTHLHKYSFMQEFTGETRLDSGIVVACEGIINAFLAAEVVIGMIVYQWDYFKYWSNVLDFVLTFTCLVFYVIFIEEKVPGRVNTRTQNGLMNERTDGLTD